MKKKVLFLALLGAMLGIVPSFTFAQFSAWQYQVPVSVTNNTGVARTDYQVKFVIDTQVLIGQGKLQADGRDLRFGDDCAGINYDYWIEDYLNTDSTVVWVRLDSIGLGATQNLSMFYGNANATVASSFSATFPNAVVTTGSNVNLTPGSNYGWLEIAAGDTAFLTSGVINDLDVRMAKISGAIWGRARGYQALGSSNNGSGPGGGIWGSSSGAGGGSYGGAGGAGGYDSGDPINTSAGPYGTQSGLDIDMGSTGGNASTTIAGHGGGCFKLNADWLVLDGTINCDGGTATQPGGGQGSGGGAGGGVFLKAYEMDFSGSISASGGGPSIGTSTANDDGGGGGGGRIKLFYDTMGSITGTMAANGGPGGLYGTGAPGQPGAVGTTWSDTSSYVLIMPLVGAEGPNQSPSVVVGSTSVCQGSTVSLSFASGFSNYSFSDPTGVLQAGLDSTFSFTATANTSIYTAVTGACVYNDTLNFTVNALPIANLTVQPGQFCEGDSIALSVDSGFVSILWSNGSTGQTTFASMAGAYSVMVTDTNGCVGNDTAVVSFLPTPVPVVSQSGNMMSTTTNYVSYQWMLNGAPVVGETSASILTSSSGSYTVMVSDSNGCTGESLPFVFVGIESGQLQSFNVSPNPFQSALQLKAGLQHAGNVELEVLDLAGRIVFKAQYQVASSQFDVQIELPQLPAGAYLVRLSTEEGMGIAKVLKQ